VRKDGTMSARARHADVERWRAKIAGKFDSKPEYLIPILQFVQGEEGYLPPEAMEAAARHLRIPESKVYGVASFYAQFNFEPQGKNKLTICRGTACHVRGSGPLLREMENHLGVEAGRTTPDMSFTLETVACFGACALAPVVVINGVVYRQQTGASLKNLVTATQGSGTCSAAKGAPPRKTSRSSTRKAKDGARSQRREKGRVSHG
jgi:NADH-quinone oxidoreductase subunit E